jgi:hypothetical protein|uniref:Uncharacterized protein n=1 Tax=Picea glauca TaxID=3330 RepID=A0A117NIA7_PICGL|nr:hypothetical protein ABT39_MTgene2894 [Picea glauca]QHR87572.1 hypothetical protein Q903MT_gene1583 [Picea sitchensis]
MMRAAFLLCITLKGFLDKIEEGARLGERGREPLPLLDMRQKKESEGLRKKPLKPDKRRSEHRATLSDY